MQLIGVCSQNLLEVKVRTISYGVRWDSIYSVSYAAVYSNPITDILPVRPKNNECICYQNYLKNSGQYVTVYDCMFSLYCCINDHDFWVTLSDYYGMECC